LPTSIDPQPGENEFECANCGAYVHYELTRCPNCGINLYEPEDEDRSPDATSTSSPIRHSTPSNRFPASSAVFSATQRRPRSSKAFSASKLPSLRISYGKSVATMVSQGGSLTTKRGSCQTRRGQPGSRMPFNAGNKTTDHGSSPKAQNHKPPNNSMEPTWPAAEKRVQATI